MGARVSLCSRQDVKKLVADATAQDVPLCAVGAGAYALLAQHAGDLAVGGSASHRRGRRRNNHLGENEAGWRGTSSSGSSGSYSRDEEEDEEDQEAELAEGDAHGDSDQDDFNQKQTREPTCGRENNKTRLSMARNSSCASESEQDEVELGTFLLPQSPKFKSKATQRSWNTGRKRHSTYDQTKGWSLAKRNITGPSLLNESRYGTQSRKLIFTNCFSGSR
eukprot:GHVT01066148.1.p1 GENE.GHVT01066148.1~~GHVT01066148.1.p1  ORF type:complete len:221 (+),score=35.16 GHVT01066148.1:419-1081(+)